MDITIFKRHTVSECHCCGELIVVESHPASWDPSFPQAGPISEAYKKHVSSSRRCKEWHDALPTFEHLRGIMKTSSEDSHG